MSEKALNGGDKKTLRTERVLFSKDKRRVRDIYTSSFSKEERMPFGMMTAMSLLWNTEFLSFYDGDTLCGFVYLANMGRMSFVMFFAVDEALRSKGYGSGILDLLQKKRPKNKTVVTIEPTDTEAKDIELRRRRKAFYLRNGFSDTGYKTRMSGITQEILIKNGEFSKQQLRLFLMLYSNLTMFPPIWKDDQRAK